MTAFLRRWSPPVIVLVCIGIVWEVSVQVLDVPRYILPPPSDLWAAFTEIQEVVPGHLATTVSEALLGLMIGAAGGAGVAGLLYASPFARRTVLPLLVATQTVPIIVTAPLFVLWFGLGLLPKILVVALATFFPVALATAQGLANTDGQLLDTLRSMGARRRDIARLALVPSAAASFFAGLRISAAYSVQVATVSEWIGASSGLGVLITRAQSSFRVDRVLVAVFIVTVVSIAAVTLVSAIARLAMPWHHALKQSEATSKGIS